MFQPLSPVDRLNPLLIYERTFKEANTSIRVPNLDIKKHWAYEIEVSKEGSVNSEITVAVNDINTAAQYNSQFIYVSGTGVTPARPAANFLSLAYSNSGNAGAAWGKLFLTPDGYATMIAEMTRGIVAAGTSIDFGLFASHSLFSMSNITSLTFQAATGGIGAGTTIRIYRRR